MKILVACEWSGAVRDAFTALGHDATSCDLLPSATTGKHVQGDVRPLLQEQWDMVIAFPPCTHLCVSGARYFAEKRSDGRQQAGIDFFMLFANLDCPRVAIENPVGIMSTLYRKPDQIIQPWQFGHPESKSTCLWLRFLPKLQPTNVLHRPAWVRCECCDDYLCTIHKGQHVADCPCPDIDAWAKRGLYPYVDGGRWDNQCPSGQNKLGPSPERERDRGRTYPGIAAAMAQQWGT